MNESNLIMIVGLLCAVIGFVLGGGVVAVLRGSKEEPKPDSNLEPVLRVWRDLRRGDLVTEVDGRLAHSAHDLTPEQARRVAQTLQALRFWLGPAGGAPAPTPVAANPPSNRPAEPARSGPARPAAPPPASEPQKPGSFNPIDVIAKAVSADYGKAQPAPKSIASQIDEILQEKLKDSPLEHRAIRLMELPVKGMVVMVGLDQYEGIDQVPDASIRQVIREAVADWERRVGGA